jgi:protein ImuA
MLALATRPRRGEDACAELCARLAGADVSPSGSGYVIPAAAVDGSPSAAAGEIPGAAADAALLKIPLRSGGRGSAGVLRLNSDPVAQLRKARLAELAQQVRRICRRGVTNLPPCPSGLPELDQALGGGFARGAINELISACEGAAARTIALRAGVRAAGWRQTMLFIDSAGDFYPPGAAQLGVSLERLVIVRPASRIDALWACEQALRCTALAAVIMSLARPFDTQTSRRLQLAAEAGRNIGLLIYGQQTPDGRTSRTLSTGQTFAATRIRLEPLDNGAASYRGGIHARSAKARLDTATLLRHSRATRPGSVWRVTILKLREGQPTEPFELELPDPNSYLLERPQQAVAHADMNDNSRRDAIAV